MNFKINNKLRIIWRLFLGILLGSSIGVFTGSIILNIMNPEGWWHLNDEISRITIIKWFFIEFWSRIFVGTIIVGVPVFLILHIQKRQPVWIYLISGIPAGIIGDVVLDRGEQVWFPYVNIMSLAFGELMGGDVNSLISLAYFPLGLFFLTLCSIISLLAFWLISVKIMGKKQIQNTF